MKLKQIKEFNKETVTNDIAFEIFAIVAWNHYKEEKYKSQGFEVEEEFYGQSTRGTTQMHSTNWNNPEYKLEGFERTFSGLKLIPNCGTSHQFYLNKNGKIDCWCVHNKGDIRGYNPETGFEYYDKFSKKREMQYNFLKLIQLYLDYGFYTIEQ